MMPLVFFALGYALTGAVLALLRLAVTLVVAPLRWLRGRPQPVREAVP